LDPIANVFPSVSGRSVFSKTHHCCSFNERHISATTTAYATTDDIWSLSARSRASEDEKDFANHPHIRAIDRFLHGGVFPIPSSISLFPDIGFAYLDEHQLPPGHPQAEFSSAMTHFIHY
jgi:hypothetical protein